MTTATKTREKGNPTAELPISKGEVAVFQAPRLPYHDAIKERFGMDRGSWKVLTEAIFPNAKSVDAIVLALAYCQSRNLDIMKRPVHIVPMYSASLQNPDGSKGGYVETIWPSIAELRTTAFRTGNYAGCDQAEFGPLVERAFEGRVQEWENGQRNWVTKKVSVKFPEWCRITVHRQLNGQRCTFVGPKVLWLESYATIGKTDLPNEMWQSRPEGQIEKCAEAAALRRAFPEELGNEYAAEEMEGRVMRDVTPPAAPKPQAPTPPDPDAPPPEIIPPPSAAAAGRSTEERSNGAADTTAPDAANQAEKSAAPGADLLMNLTELVSDMKTKKTLVELDGWHRDMLVTASIEDLSDADRRLFDRAHDEHNNGLSKKKK